MTSPLLLAVAISLVAAAVAEAQVTPTPQLAPGSPCPAEVTLRWDVRDVPGANRVLWEVDDDQFSNPNGPEQDRLAFGTSDLLLGQVVIDLRQLGPVLDGSSYLFRVVAKNGNQDVALRSQPVVFDLLRTADGTFTARPVAGSTDAVEIDWSSLQNDIRGCSDAVFWELKQGAGFVSQGPDPTRDASGSAALGANRTVADVSGLGGGPFFVRLVGKHGGLDAASDVGRRGTGVEVSMQVPRPPHTGPRAPQITSFRVGSADGGGGFSAFAGSIPFEFTSSGATATHYRVADCDDFRSGGGRFVPVPRFPSRSQAVRLEAGRQTACLQLAADPDDERSYSEVAKVEVGVLALPEAPRVRDLAFQVGRKRATLAESGEAIIPLLQYVGEADEYRLDSCTKLARAPWQPLKGGPGNVRLPAVSRQQGGLYDFCVQVRLAPEPGRPPVESNTRSAQLEIVELANYEAPYDEALDLAQKSGFVHRATNRGSGGYCLVGVEENRRLMFPEAAVQSTSECSFSLFGGRRLADRWSVVELSLDGGSGKLTVDRRPSGNNPNLVATLEGGSHNLFLDRSGFKRLTIVLRGPAGKRWQDAFGR